MNSCCLLQAGRSRVNDTEAAPSIINLSVVPEHRAKTNLVFSLVCFNCVCHLIWEHTKKCDLSAQPESGLPLVSERNDAGSK